MDRNELAERILRSRLSQSILHGQRILKEKNLADCFLEITSCLLDFTATMN